MADGLGGEVETTEKTEVLAGGSQGRELRECKGVWARRMEEGWDWPD